MVKSGSHSKYVYSDEFQNTGEDFLFIGLCGIGTGNFGWGDWGVPPENEKVGFRYIQKTLVDHYAWFQQEYPEGFWLRW